MQRLCCPPHLNTYQESSLRLTCIRNCRTILIIRSAPPPNSTDTWTTGVLTSTRLDEFAAAVLPTKVQLQLKQAFGKDSSIHHSFYAEKCFRHILLPLFKSAFLSCRATKMLEKASRRARQLQQLRKKYRTVNFLPLQGFQPDWEETTTIRDDWKDMTTACLLHFNGDVASMVRWIGGPHVNAHLDVTQVLSTLLPIVTPDVYNDVRRILTFGPPALCNADATEKTFKRSGSMAITNLLSPTSQYSRTLSSSKVSEALP